MNARSRQIATSKKRELSHKIKSLLNLPFFGTILTMKLKHFFQTVPAAVFFAATLTGCSNPEPRSRTETVEKMAETLELVTDSASADSAAKMYFELQSAIAKLPAVAKEDIPQAQVAVGNLLGQIHRLEKNNFYDSDALKEALNLK